MATANLIFDLIGRDKSASSTIDALGKKFGKTQEEVDKFKTKTTVGLNVAGAAATAFAISSINAASDLNETLNKSEGIFGKNAAAMETWAEGAATSAGLSKAAALDAASGFGDMFSQLGFTSDQAAGMSKDTVQLAADLGSFNNLGTDEVLDKISGAMRGEYDSLQALIPNINAARVEQEALAMSGKTATDELTAQEKAAATLAIIQKDGARAAGDFAKTSDGLANSQKILQAEFANVQGQVGTAFLPAMTAVMGVLVEVAIWVSENKTVVGILVGTIVAVTAAQWLWNAAMMANPIGLIIIGIAALVAGIVWVAKNTTLFQDVWEATTNGIATAWNWLWGSVLKPVFDFIGAAWNWLYNTVIVPVVTGIGIYIAIWAAAFSWLWNTVLSPVFNAIGAALSWVWDSVISPVVGWISDKVTVLGLGFSILWSDYISPALDAVGKALNWVWGTIISPVFNAISNAVTWVGDTIRSAFDGVADFIGNAFNAVLDVVRGPVNGIIGLVNGAIGGLNKLSVTIPDWVPIVGGQTWGLDIPKIPLLAKGGILTGPTLFVGGEGGETEVVQPLSKLDRFMRDYVPRDQAVAQAAPSVSRLHPDDIAALAAAVLDGSKRIARGEITGAGRAALAGVR